MRRTGTILLGLAAGLAATAVLAIPAQAAQQIEEFKTTMSTSIAGGHPDLQTSFRLKDAGTPETAKNITFDAPPGVFGNPGVVTQCRSADFALQECPPNAQVGLITVRANHAGDPDDLLGTAPLYSVDPGPDETARFAFIAPTLEIPIAIPVTTRSATDYGLRFTVSGITQLSPLAAVDMTFWGFPGLPSHDAQRFAQGSPGSPAGCPGLADAGCIVTPTPASLPVRPLTGNPSDCNGEELKTTLVVQTYQDPSVLSRAESSYPPVVECIRQTFNPAVRARLTTQEADSPSGLELEITVPQAQGFGVSPSEIRASVLTLPRGLTINPDAADGQSACTDAEASLGVEGAGNCPDNSKIGTVRITSVALPGDIVGSIYFGQPQPGNQYRLFLFADGYGVHAKLIGSLLPDPQTGQITASFDDLPQLPFDSFSFNLFASDRGVLATPTRCTLHVARTRLFPWNSVIPDRASEIAFSIESGPGGSACPGVNRPFKPRLVAGTSNPTAGSFSDFTLKLDRDDGDQFLGKLNFTMPPGLAADLRGVAYCPESAIAAAAGRAGRAEQSAASCPASSAIGTSNVAAGPGSHPFHAYGRLYMAGPFKGAPLSLVAVTPALAGPYDYGTVVIRVAIHVDPSDAHVFADSETVPSIIGGVPIRMRSIQVNIDRPNFMLNPTNCTPSTVASQGIGDEGAVAGFSTPFTATNCAPLPFKPRMSIAQLGGRGVTTRSKNPSLRFDLWARGGDANVKSVAVTLPTAFQIDQRHLGNLCSKAQLAAERCAGRAAIGTVRTETPLLDKPLEGPAYAVSGFGKLPHLFFILDGQVTLMPEAMSSSVRNGQLKTDRPGRSRRPDRPLPPRSLRRQAGLPEQHPQPLRHPGGEPRRVRRPERQDRHPEGEGEDLLRLEVQEEAPALSADLAAAADDPGHGAAVGQFEDSTGRLERSLVDVGGRRAAGADHAHRAPLVAVDALQGEVEAVDVAPFVADVRHLHRDDRPEAPLAAPAEGHRQRFGGRHGVPAEDVGGDGGFAVAPAVEGEHAALRGEGSLLGDVDMAGEVPGADQRVTADLERSLAAGREQPAPGADRQPARGGDGVAVDLDGDALQGFRALTIDRRDGARDMQGDRRGLSARQRLRADPTAEGDLHIAAADDVSLRDPDQGQHGDSYEQGGAAHVPKL